MGEFEGSQDTAEMKFTPDANSKTLVTSELAFAISNLATVSECGLSKS